MAKVMVSLPDKLLLEVDNEAARQNSTRSAMLRKFTEAGLKTLRTNRSRGIEQLLKTSSRHGGNSTDFLKSNRPK